MVDANQGECRGHAISVDVKRGDVVVKSLISSRLSVAVSILSLLFVVPDWGDAASAQQRTQPERLQTKTGTDPEFLSALRSYQAQQYPAAQKQLETLLRKTPGSFQINELLGLVYVAQGEQAKANRFLAKAVLLQPSVTEARTALATNLLALRREDDAEIQFKKAVELNPQSYDTNHNLGEYYVQVGRITAAIPYLQRAQEADPAAYNNGYDLALALDQTGKLDEARHELQHLISLQDSAELHSLLGEVEEKSRNYLSAAAQYEQAARLEPSEQNILNWGAELVLHQTFAPAIDVFKAGTQHFPQSAPLSNGLGIALYGMGQTDDAVRAFFRASDLAASDPLPLIFLGKACDSASPALADQIRFRLQNFVTRGPQRPEITYYFAMCLWKTNQSEAQADRDSQVESLLKRALTLDPNYADAYFQLGSLYADERKYKEATEQYELALKINPNAANTHYRLGQVFGRLGDPVHAQEEFAVFEKLRQSESDATNKELNQIQQFVYKVRESNRDPR